MIPGGCPPLSPTGFRELNSQNNVEEKYFTIPTVLGRTA